MAVGSTFGVDLNTWGKADSMNFLFMVLKIDRQMAI
jgi:hypothetical protein